MRSYGVVHTSIWRDEDFVGLPVREQHVYILLFSQPDITACGVIPFRPRRWAKLSADLTLNGLTRALHRLEESRFVFVDAETAELLVRTFARHDGRLGKSTGVSAIRHSFLMVESAKLRNFLLVEYPDVLGSLQGEEDTRSTGPRSSLTKDLTSPFSGPGDRSGSQFPAGPFASSTPLDERAARFVRDVGFQYADRELEQELSRLGVSRDAFHRYLELARLRRANQSLFEEGSP